KAVYGRTLGLPSGGWGPKRPLIGEARSGGERMNGRWTTKLWIGIFLLPTVIVLAMFYIVPIVTVLVTGFMDWDGFTAPTFAGLSNYIQLFTYDDTFAVSLRNLFLWSLIAAILHVGFGTLVAFI